MIPRRPGFAAESFFASDWPVVNESAGPSTSNEASARSVFSNFATVTERDLSRTVVPWISPALEQPTTIDFGYVFASVAKHDGSARISDAPNARTSERSESSSGKSFTDHFFPSTS